MPIPRHQTTLWSRHAACTLIRAVGRDSRNSMDLGTPNRALQAAARALKALRYLGNNKPAEHNDCRVPNTSGRLVF